MGDGIDDEGNCPPHPIGPAREPILALEVSTINMFSVMPALCADLPVWRSSLIKLPINFWRNSDPFENKDHFSSSKI